MTAWSSLERALQLRSWEVTFLRLLVLSGSRVLPRVVARLAPAGVEVESARTLAAAGRRLREHPPEAMIVNVRPASAPWEELRELCEGHEPPIPVLYESCVFHDPAEAGLGRLSPCGHFLEKPYTIDQLRSEVEWLVREAENHCDETAEGALDEADPVH